MFSPCRAFCLLFVAGSSIFIFFFFNDTATTEIYTLSLHDALPICPWRGRANGRGRSVCWKGCGTAKPLQMVWRAPLRSMPSRSEEHTSELQSRLHLVCRLLLEKKNKILCMMTCP